MAPNISVASVTATSVTLSWTRPDFSLPVEYVASVTPLPESAQVLCAVGTTTIEIAPIGSTMMDFTGLQEFVVYAANVTVRQGDHSFMLGSTQFTTLSAGMPDKVVT